METGGRDLVHAEVDEAALPRPHLPAHTMPILKSHQGNPSPFHIRVDPDGHAG